jgi:hypothetical protein
MIILESLLMENKEENKDKEGSKCSPNSYVIRISLKQVSIEFIMLVRSDWSNYLFIQKGKTWFAILDLEFKYSILIWYLIKNIYILYLNN